MPHPNMTPRFILSSRADAMRLTYHPALVELRLPLGFSALPIPDRKAIVERELTRVVAIAADVIDNDR